MKLSASSTQFTRLRVSPAVQGVQRIMLGPPRPEPVGEALEVRLVDRVQHLADGALEDLVLQRRDGRGIMPLLPVTLRVLSLSPIRSTR